MTQGEKSVKWKRRQNLGCIPLGAIRIRISDPRSLGSWCIKATDESVTRVDSSVPLMHQDPSDLGSGHSCPVLSNRLHPTKQHSICCRSENCISLARSGQSAVDSIGSFDLSNGKVYYRFNKCGRRSDHCISLVTTATRCKIVESIDSFRLVGMVISFTITH